MIRKYNPQSEKRYTPVQLGEISKICKLCDYEPDCKEHDAAIRKDERDKFLKRMLECISQYEMLPNGMDFVIEDLLAELRQEDESHCDKCDHWDICEGCPYTDERTIGGHGLVK